MSSEYESLEKLLKPTRKSRGILLVAFFVGTAIQIVSTSYLSEKVNGIVNSVEGGYPFFVTLVNYSLKIRYAIALLGIIGIFHTRITPWTISTSLTFIGYMINMFMRFYVVYKSYGYWEKLKSIASVLFELELNMISFLFGLLFVYQSFCIHSVDKVSLDMEDPSKAFVTRLIKSLISIVPGLGFFRKKLFSVAKLDSYVYSTNKECE